MPFTLTVETTIPAPAARVWEVLESAEAQERLEPRATLVSATSGPLVVGSRMELSVRGVRVVNEAVEVEPGRRVRWRQSARRQVVFQGAVLEPIGPDATRVTWTVEHPARWPLVGLTRRLVRRELEPWVERLAHEVAG